MKLFKQVSDRKDVRGRPYIDYYIAFTYNDHHYFVRIRPSFYHDAKLLFAEAEDVPSGEMLEKFM